MSRDPRLFLEDIRESCLKIIRYTQNLNFEAFRTDEKTLDAVIRNLTIIGEAVKHLPEEIRKRYPGVNWRAIAGLRDIVVHEYFGIDKEILWDVVTNEVPELLRAVENILDREFKE
ncbi:MAG: nucleotidyltransferase [Deltaproteobacteria bacterium]|nr:MAG: nucleotidyltransferase [Deltaproteobacteria bacterium]